MQRLFALLVFGNVEEKPRLFEVRAVLGPGVDSVFKR
jgi:hypothetical protein